MRRIAYTAVVARQLRGLPAKAREQIQAKLRRYANTGSGDVKALTGQTGARLRVGDFRVVFTQTADEILAREVANRRDIYR
jgi:mRNA interferase RelE/StbE